ncbi:MAG: autoinducer binding domain-containing protein [Cohaesibacteraceae bacterium]
MLNNAKIIRFLDRTNGSMSIERIWDSFNEEIKDYGFVAAGYAFSNGLKQGAIADEMVYFGSYRNDYVQTYIDERLADDDYAMLYGSANDAPAFWSDIVSMNMTAGRARFQSIASDFGLKEGLVVPFRGGENEEAPRSGVALQSDSEQPEQHRAFVKAYLGEIVQLCAVFDNAMRRPTSIKEMYGLSPRELECIKHLCHGRTNKEIADRLALSDKTVEHYIAKAMSKLKSRNRHHAAAKAVLPALTKT